MFTAKIEGSETIFKAPFCLSKFKLAPKAKPEVISGIASPIVFTTVSIAVDPPFKLDEKADKPLEPAVPPNKP